MSQIAEVILFYGAPYSGRTLYYHSKLSDTYTRVCPDDIFRQNPELTLRQLVNKNIIGPLKQGDKVVVDDSFQTFAKRDSYRSLINKKIPSCPCRCHVFRPKYGTEQLHWAHEYSRAQMAALYNAEEVESRPNIQIDHWLAKQELPDKDEGFTIHEVITRLQAESLYKFEVPALLIQYEGMFRNELGDVNLVDGTSKAISLWYQSNPCGRVLVLSDGNSSLGVAGGERENQIKHLMKDLVKKIPDCPVYVLAATPQVNSTGYSDPPQPGLIAFLQRTHTIDLYHPGTMYLYHTSSHIKMAERAGLRHIKASRVFNHPTLSKSNHGTVQPPIPDMLKDLQVIPPCDLGTRMVKSAGSTHTDKAIVPLYDQMTGSHDTGVYNMAPGRDMYGFVKDLDTIERYQDLYSSNASQTTSPGPSKVLALSRHSTSLTRLSQTAQSSSSVLHTNPNQSEPDPSSSVMDRSRGLPKWMLGGSTEKKKKLKDSVDESLTNSLKRHNSDSDMMYILSAAELVETAKLILREAGKPVPTDEEIQASLNNEDMLVDMNTDHTHPKATEGCEPYPKSILASKKPRHSKKVVPDVWDDILAAITSEDEDNPSDKAEISNSKTKNNPTKIIHSSSATRDGEKHSTGVIDKRTKISSLSESKPRTQQRETHNPRGPETHNPQGPETHNPRGPETHNPRGPNTVDLEGPEQPSPFNDSILDQIFMDEVPGEHKRNLLNVSDSHDRNSAPSRRNQSESQVLDAVMVADSLVTGRTRRGRPLSSDSDGGTGGQRSGDVVPDSLVPETVTTIPETVLSVKDASGHRETFIYNENIKKLDINTKQRVEKNKYPPRKARLPSTEEDGHSVLDGLI